MNKKLTEILTAWKEKYGENMSVYPDERIAEIATNCMSLAQVWLESIKNVKNISLELSLYNKDNVLCDILHGINDDNLVETMLDILVNKHEKYSKISLNYYSYVNGSKREGLVGEMDIS